MKMRCRQMKQREWMVEERAGGLLRWHGEANPSQEGSNWLIIINGLMGLNRRTGERASASVSDGLRGAGSRRKRRGFVRTKSSSSSSGSSDNHGCPRRVVTVVVCKLGK